MVNLSSKLVRMSAVAGTALMLSAATIPARAAPAHPAPVATPAPAPVQQRAATGDTKYCVTTTLTGTYIPRTICRERDYMKQLLGVDPAQAQ